MFQTNNCSSSGSHFHKRSIQNFIMHLLESNHIVLAPVHPYMHDKVLYAACTEIIS